MKKHLLTLSLLLSVMSLFAHPSGYSLREVFYYSSYIVAGEVVEKGDKSILLLIDTVFYGEKSQDTITVYEDCYMCFNYADKEGINEIGNKKLLFLYYSRASCNPNTLKSTGIYYEGEFTIQDDSVKSNWGSKAYHYKTFIQAALDYKKVENGEFKGEYSDFATKSSIHAEVITEHLEVENKKLAEQKGWYKTSPVISATKMNVIYCGVINPIQVAMDGYHAKGLEVKASSGELTNKGNGHYWINPNRPGKIRLSVFDSETQDSLGTASFRVKHVPIPQPKYTGESGGIVNHSKLRAGKQIIATLPNFDFDLRFYITSFSMKTNTSETVYHSCSPRLTPEMKDAITALAKGNTFTFYDIKVNHTSKGEVTLESITFQVK